MISFKLFFESATASVITPADVYTFYYISNLKNRLLGSEHNKDSVVNFLNSLKSKYLNTFGKVLKDQIIKYLKYQKAGQKRIRDNAEVLKINIEEFEKTPVTNFDKLEQYIKETTRSARHDYKPNEDWNMFAEWINKLSKKQISAGALNIQGSENVLFIIDRINNCVHNTGESIFDKVRENGSLLIRAFDEAHSARDVSFLKNKSLPEIKELEITEVQENIPAVSNVDKYERQFGGSSFYSRSGY
jgi:hypothetical protein